MILKRAVAKDGTIFRRVDSGFHRTGGPAPGAVRPPARSLTRVYDAAVMTRLTSDWTFSPLSADAEIRQNFRNLRARSREQERNDSYAERYYTLAEQNVIGSAGIGLQMKLLLEETLDESGQPKRELDTVRNRALERAWKRQNRRQNYTIERSLSGTAADKLILRTMLRDGDLLIRKIRGARNDFGFAVQMIEGDFLDDTYTDFRAVRCQCPQQFGLPMCEHGTHEIRMGVELHGDWRFPVAYWLLGAHPGDYLVGTAIYAQSRIRVPVGDIIHPFIRKRPGQTRGIPALASAMLRLHMIGGYSEAELVAARAGAQKMGFIESDVPESMFEQYYDPDTQMAEITGSPGEIEELPVGKRFKEWDPTHPNGNFAGFVKEQIRAVAAGGNVSYTSLSGNIEDVNFSSIRAGLLEEREGWKGLQTFFIDEVKREIFRAWLECALLSPLLDLPYDPDEYCDEEACIWKPRRWPWVDPAKDLDAKKGAIESNLETATNVIAETGGDLEEVYAELAYEKQLRKKLDIETAEEKPQPAAAPAAEKNPQPEAEGRRSACLGDIVVQELPAAVQAEVATFAGGDASSKVIRYGMTVPELLAKADQHNWKPRARMCRG
jgi:lambda family phage portal protein